MSVLEVFWTYLLATYLVHDLFRSVLIIGGEVDESLGYVLLVHELGEGGLLQTNDVGRLLWAVVLAQTPVQDFIRGRVNL